MAVGKKLRAIREAQGKKREEAAVGAGVSYGTLIQVELEKIKHPSFTIVEKLANYYGISIDELREEPHAKAS